MSTIGLSIMVLCNLCVQDLLLGFETKSEFPVSSLLSFRTID